MITQDDIRRAARLEQLQGEIRAAERGKTFCVWVVCFSVLGLLMILVSQYWGAG